MRAKVVIIGAGIAGLSAASHLYRAGLGDVIILEACNRYESIQHAFYTCCKLFKTLLA